MIRVEVPLGKLERLCLLSKMQHDLSPVVELGMLLDVLYSLNSR